MADDVILLAQQRPLTFTGTWVKPLLKLVQQAMEERIIKHKLVRILSLSQLSCSNSSVPRLTV